MYLIFGGEERASGGGANDFIESVVGDEYCAIERAKSMIGATAIISNNDGPVIGWVHVYCVTTNEIVHSIGFPSNYRLGRIKEVIYEVQ